MSDALAGAVGAMLSIYVGLPLDTVKVRLQTQDVTSTYRGALDFFSRTVQGEGIRALWKGAIPAVTSSMIETSVVFLANGILYRMFVKHDEKPTFAKQTALNGSSALCSGFFITPCEMVKCRLQVALGSGQSSHMFHCIRQIHRELGITGFWTGLLTTWSRDVPFYMLFFGTYTTYKTHVLGKQGEDSTGLHPFHYIMGGGLAGLVGWGIMFPFDLIKSRQQTLFHIERKSLIGVARSIFAHHGLRGFYHGWLPCVLRAWPAEGSLFFGYEGTLMLCDKLGMNNSYSLNSRQLQIH